MRRLILAGVVLLLLALGIRAVVDGDGDEHVAARIVTTTDGEMLVLDDGRDGFPGVLLIPVFGLLAFGFLAFAFGPRRWAGPVARRFGLGSSGPWGGGRVPGWVEEWHRAAHAGGSAAAPLTEERPAASEEPRA